jgi:hypothetical protein
VSKQCETQITTYQPFRLGLNNGCHETKQCENPATLEVTVKGQGKMLICDSCLPRFREYAILPWKAKPLRQKVGAKP